MADSTIDNLTAAVGTDLDDADLFLVLDGTNPPKKITRAELVKGLFGTGVAGDILYHNGTSYVRLAKGTAYQSLRMNSGATAPEYGEPPLGVGQTWSDVTGSRAFATDYTNSTGRAIFISVKVSYGNVTGDLYLTVDGNILQRWEGNPDLSNMKFTIVAPIPAGSTYRITDANANGTLSAWFEWS